MKKWEKLEHAKLYFLECDEKEHDTVITTENGKLFAKYVPYNVNPVTKEWNGADSLQGLKHKYEDDTSFKVDMLLNNQTFNFGNEKEPIPYTVPFTNEWVQIVGCDKDELEPLQDNFDRTECFTWEKIASFIGVGKKATEDDFDIMIMYNDYGTIKKDYFYLMESYGGMFRPNCSKYVAKNYKAENVAHVFFTLKGQTIEYMHGLPNHRDMYRVTLPDTGVKVLVYGISKAYFPKLVHTFEPTRLSKEERDRIVRSIEI